MERLLFQRILGLRSVPPQVIVLSAVASYGAQAIAALQGWPLWAIVLATLLPWMPVLARETVWTYRHYSMLALFYVLVVTQIGHFGEHLVQVVQIHVLHLSGVDARGIFGALDIEWVHFIFNTYIIIAEIVLLRYFRKNPWLWAGLVVAIWHELEHVVIMYVYLTTGVAGSPGLLSQGGLIAGGLPFIRADVHFVYNLVETLPILAGFVYQLKFAYDEWLAKAFPHLPQQALAETTSRVHTLRFSPGDLIVRQGEVADRLYIIAKGEVSVIHQTADGRDKEVARRVAGEYFGEIGLLSYAPRSASVRARTDVEVLALDRDAFRQVVEKSEPTEADLTLVAHRRLAALGA